MTERDAFEVSETKLRLLRERGNVCEVCGQPIGPYNTQLAHRVIKSKANLAQYGKEVIHHDKNLAITCSLECNGNVIVNGLKKERLIAEIQEAIKQGELF